MTRITSAAYVAAGKTLLGQAQKQTIPYVANGMSLGGMDCQGLAEYLLIQCGVPKAECNLAGSNAHWRNCVWRGTPEACKASFGAVSEGAWLFILSESDGGAPEKYRGDGLGDAYHMGVYLGGCAIHASSSRGYVAESKFEGKTIKNGGWNMIGLPPWVDYGGHVNAVLAARTESASEADGKSGDDSGGATSPSAPERYLARIVAPNGGTVKMRAKPEKSCNLYKEVPCGEVVPVVDRTVKGGRAWCRVERGSRSWYIMEEFMQRIEG